MAEGATGFGTGAQGASNAGLTGLTGGSPSAPGNAAQTLMPPALAKQFNALQGYAQATVRRLARGLPALDEAAPSAPKPPEGGEPRPQEAHPPSGFRDAADPFGGASVRTTRVGDVDVDFGDLDTADGEAVRAAFDDVSGMLGEMGDWYGKNA